MENISRAFPLLDAVTQKAANFLPAEEKSRIVKICMIKYRCFISLLLALLLLPVTAYMLVKETVPSDEERKKLLYDMFQWNGTQQNVVQTVIEK